VDELFDWSLPDSEPSPLRDDYIKDISAAIVATCPAAAYQLLFTRPSDASYDWFKHTDEAHLWDYVLDREISSMESAASAAAVGDLQALELYFALGCPLLDQPSLMFGNLFATLWNTSSNA
jgi:hypothetical protein